MSGSEDLLLFAHLVRKPDHELDLEQVALLIAESEYPGLDIARYVAVLDELGQRARLRITESGHRPGRAPVSVALDIILKLLYEELHFRGNTCDYYDPRNSFLNDVLERRTGIPISLALVLMAVTKRCGLRLGGVSFPGHFLVRAISEDGSPLFIDPFEGRILAREELAAMWEQNTGQPGQIDEQALAVASRRQIIGRILNNLRCIYEVRGDGLRHWQMLARLAIVNPSADAELRLQRAQTEPPAPRISIN